MNQFKTYFLLTLLTVLFILVGWALVGKNGATYALILAGMMNFIAYWFSDKIVLKMYRAREVAPGEAPELYEIVGELANMASLPMPKVYMIQSESPNAFATGRNPQNAAVAVTTGIMRTLSRNELKGVIGHELSHIKDRDILIGTVAATIAGAIAWIGTMARWGAIFGGFGDDEDSGGGNLIFVLIVTMLAGVAAMLIQMAISRSREYLADREGALLCRDPRYLANGLRKLDAGTERITLEANPSTAHLFIINPLRGRGIVNLFSTHPPIQERIRRLEEMTL
ncbi:MAG: zinc metalloprotease HtpX [Syntrophobacterales bacterium]|nr:MAG: zinc metalloprotease HtpX [Syntrophobacterales bacterium]